ncbi:MAG: hypothetical protein ACLP01_10040 [Solirubrobacteraceae bacterium]
MTPKYACRVCGQDLDEAVRLERDQELDVLRVWRDPKDATPREWAVRVFCDKDHENVFSGTGDA